jgi:hypothetical protein
MKSNVHEIRVLALIAIGSLLFAACGSAPDDSGSGVKNAERPNADGVYGNLVYSLELKPAHRIDFYEFADGQTALREAFPPGGGPAALPPLSREGVTTFGEAYQRLATPKTSVPSVLREADVRAADLRRFNYAPVAPSGDNVVRTSPLTDADVADRDQRLGEDRQALSITCSGDFFGDNWGAQWFRDNYCVPTSGLQNACFTNQWGHVAQLSTMGLVYQQFEGDFDNHGWVRMEHESCNFWGTCSWVRDFDGTVIPRDVFLWYYQTAGTRKITASSQCGHMGRSFYWQI